MSRDGRKKFAPAAGGERDSRRSVSIAPPLFRTRTDFPGKRYGTSVTTIFASDFDFHGLLSGPDSFVFGGNNGGLFLNDQTVHDDDCVDILTGSSGADWFLFNRDGDGSWRNKDWVTDMSTFESMYAQDIDFIHG